MNGIIRGIGIALALSALATLIGGALLYAHLFGPLSDVARMKEFFITPEDTAATIALRLENEGLVRSDLAARIALGAKELAPGGYQVSAEMDTWAIAKTLGEPPAIVWLSFPSGFRKEQIAGRLAGLLGWSAQEREEWDAATAQSSSFSEGVYYPGTYLIPREEAPHRIAERMRERFKDAYAPYAAEAARQGVQWTTVVTMASLISREAAGPHDMPLIAGVIWNRMEIRMPLGIDATLQYIRGEEGSWWPVVKSEDKYLESPYNTYFTSGLPPGPIASPGKDEIRAVLYPEKTECYYYLHDYDREIHCAATYKEHLANVERYLR